VAEPLRVLPGVEVAVEQGGRLARVPGGPAVGLLERGDDPGRLTSSGTCRRGRRRTSSSSWFPSSSGAARYRTSYDDGTLRERLLGPGIHRLPDTHPGAAYRHL
ncbi:hypothetical protein AB0392_30150, partial [Nonomuraea angiospora]